jgi:hypothetical protein
VEKSKILYKLEHRKNRDYVGQGVLAFDFLVLKSEAKYLRILENSKSTAVDHFRIFLEIPCNGILTKTIEVFFEIN